MMRNALAGKTIAFTGEIQGMSRKQAAQMAQAAGAFVTSSISGKTDLVIQGDFAGMKAQRAAEMGLRTISAPEFLRMTSSRPQKAAMPAARTTGTMMSAPRGRRPHTTTTGMSSAPVSTPAPVRNQAKPWETMTSLPEQTRRVVPDTLPQFSRAPVQLDGKTISFTGTLQMARSEASRAAAEAGAMVAPTVTFDVDYLVCGANPGQTKLDAAEMHETAVISEKQFLAASGQEYSEPMEMEYEMEEETPAPMMRRRSQQTAMPAMSRRPRVAVEVEPSFTREPVSLSGRTIAFTGALEMSRPEAAKLAARFGAEVSSSVTSECDYLVCGMAPGGTKVNSAHSMGVRTISEEQFMAATRGTNAVAPVRAPAPRQRTMAMPQQQVSKPRAMAAEPVFDRSPVELDGRTVVFTGTLETATRKEASAMAQTAGADVSSAITHETDFLVCGANPGATKIQDAEEMGIRTISEEQFMTAASDDVLAAAEEGEVEEEPMMEQEQEEPMAEQRIRRGRLARPQQPAMPQVQAPRRAAPTRMAEVAPSLMNKNVVFTGALEMNRLSAAVMATKAGANVASSLSSKTDFVVCGPGAGAKMEQAQSMGIPVLTEAQFIAACRA